MADTSSSAKATQDRPLQEEIGKWLISNVLYSFQDPRDPECIALARELADRLLSDIPLLGAAEGMREALEPLAKLPIGAEIAEDHDLVLYKNAGRAITVGDVFAAQDALTASCPTTDGDDHG